LRRVSDEFRTQSVWKSSFVVRAGSERRFCLATVNKLVVQCSRRRGGLAFPR
jgi:hypothetical protein